MLNYADIVKVIKAHRIQWLGRLERMDDHRKSKKILRAQVYKSRKRRSLPRLRRLDDVLEDLRRMDVRGYAEMTTGRRNWSRLVLEEKDHVGL